MFDNIGEKIKSSAIVLLVIGIIASLILGISQISNAVETSKYSSYFSSYAGTVEGASVLGGILTIVFGSIISLIASYILYGFGQLIDSTQNIEKKLSSQSFAEVNNLTDSSASFSSTTQALSDGQWACPNCNTVNSKIVTKCIKCGTKKLS